MAICSHGLAWGGVGGAERHRFRAKQCKGSKSKGDQRPGWQAQGWQEQEQEISLRTYLVGGITGDIFDCRDQRGATGIKWTEAKDAA